ncbi:MAG: hypothetical protein C0490_08790, partial [Marivirga sp.]|nr:hypothetical protein [Marivirga sp.]
MNLFFAVINICFLLFIAYRIWRAEDSSVKIFFWPALLIKLVAGICLGLVYTFYYTSPGDTLFYFEDGVKLADLARSDFRLYAKFLWLGDESFTIWNDLNVLQSRALFMVKITSFVNLLSHDNYWITTLYFSFTSFLGAWFLSKTIARFKPGIRVPAVAAFLFFPSVVFWSSGLIKESLAMAALFCLSAIYLKALMKEWPNMWQWIWMAVSLWLLWNLKYYYLAVFLPVAASSLAVILVFSPRLKSRHWFVKLTTSIIVFFVPLAVISIVHPNFYPENFLNVIVSNNREFHAISDPDDLIYYKTLQPSLESVFENAPMALFSGLFRPLPWEAGTFFQVFISIENTIL